MHAERRPRVRHRRSRRAANDDELDDELDDEAAAAAAAAGQSNDNSCDEIDSGRGTGEARTPALRRQQRELMLQQQQQQQQQHQHQQRDVDDDSLVSSQSERPTSATRAQRATFATNRLRESDFGGGGASAAAIATSAELDNETDKLVQQVIRRQRQSRNDAPRVARIQIGHTNCDCCEGDQRTQSTSALRNSVHELQHYDLLSPQPRAPPSPASSLARTSEDSDSLYNNNNNNNGDDDESQLNTISQQELRELQAQRATSQNQSATTSIELIASARATAPATSTSQQQKNANNNKTQHFRHWGSRALSLAVGRKHQHKRRSLSPFQRLLLSPNFSSATRSCIGVDENSFDEQDLRIYNTANQSLLGAPASRAQSVTGRLPSSDLVTNQAAQSSASSPINTLQQAPSDHRSRLHNRQRSQSASCVFALYAQRYARDKFRLAVRVFKSWYHEQLTYHHLCKRMEYDERAFDEWYKSRGEPVQLRALDHYDQVVIWIADERDAIQKRTFTKWINKYLGRRDAKISDLFQDLSDGQKLITLLELLSGQTLPRERGRMRVHQLQNIQIALNYIKFRKVKLVNIRPEDIVDGNQKLTLGLIWTIILHFQLEDNSNFREILLRWAQKTTDGYPGCNVTDLTTSWRDGLAFNAIIHRNRPDLLDYRGCRKKTSRENLDQAFTVGDRDLGVERLLEPEDVDVPQPDEKSMIMYLAQLYELFPNPPERNPLLDEEMIRRIDEYKELASKLLRWLKESTAKLEDRRFPKAIAELKRLKDENERFRTEEIPPKQHDKQRLAAAAREIYKMAKDVGVRIPDELHMDNIEYQWDKMLNAHKARGKALDDEIAKAERLRSLLEKLLNDIRRTDERLDGIERDMNAEERRMAHLNTIEEIKGFSPDKLRKFSEELADCGIKIDSIKRLADDFIHANGRSEPDSVMVRERVSELDGKYKRLLGKLNKLNEAYERALKRLHELEEARRRAQAQKEAEAKLRMKLDAMKRRLDELERRIDSMGPVAKDLPTLQKQLAELNQFDKDLSKTRDDLNDLIKLAEDMIRDELIADPPALRRDLQALKDQLARIEDKAARRLREFEEALKRAERQKAAEQELNMRLDGIKRELEELERRLDAMAPVGKDVATLQRQLAEMGEFDRDLARTAANLDAAARLAEDMIRDELISDPVTLRMNIRALKDHLARIEDKAARRTKAIQDALNRAERQREAEAKLQLKLDAMKRELDDKERQLDSMAPVARDLSALQAQLAEIQSFIEGMGQTRRNLNELIKLAEDMIREDLIADPAKLRQGLKALKEQLARIDDKAGKRLRAIQDAMSRVAATDAIQEVKQWLDRARKVLVDEENVRGDLDTVNALIEQHKSFEQELADKQPAIAEVRRMEAEMSRENGALVRDELNALLAQVRDMEKLTRDKSTKLADAQRMAEQMHADVHKLLEWLADAEMKLRFAGHLPDDEQATKQELAEHDKFMRRLAQEAQNKDKTLKLAKDILAKCHPDAEPVVAHWINIIGSRWDEIDAWAKQRTRRLNDHLRSLMDILELVSELLGWLQRHEGRLLAEESAGAESLPDNAHQLEALIDQHANFMDELRKREPDVDRVVKIFASKSGLSTSKIVLTTTTTTSKPQQQARASSSSSRYGSRSATPTRTSFATYRDEYPEVRQPRARLMLDKWRCVWQLSLDKMQRLQDRVEHIHELERLENFDFDQWRRRFLAFVNTNKGRVMDFFRSIDDDNDGRIPNDSFISGVMRSKFDTSRLEMERVVQFIDRNSDGTIDNKEYLDSLKPDKPVTDDELIQDEVQRQVSKCTCKQRFKVYHVGEGRYRFGESQKLRLVRILRSTVMVRVGGGWEPLATFLQKNDPCRAKGRTNVELREQFILPEGASQAMAAFKTRLAHGSTPTLGPITKIREKTERSMPMSASSATGSRLGSPSDYYSETDTSSRARSRIARLTPQQPHAHAHEPSTSSSRPGSRLSNVEQQRQRRQPSPF